VRTDYKSWMFVLTSALFIAVPCLAARKKDAGSKSLSEYISRVEASSAAPTHVATLGSLWLDNGKLADLSTDYKAKHVGDLVRILIVQDTTATNTANVGTDRSFKASSGIDALAGHVSTSGVQTLFSPRSSQTLQGKAQASSKSTLRTSLTGSVVATLSTGALVVEAERSLTMNNERQTVILRGIVRGGDIAPDNSLLSNQLSNLELELKGKGVISDGTRPPNVIMRVLLRIVGF
jgi:flagellar L-ring protein precursor FlgH